MDIFEAMDTARAIRHLKADPVPDELIDKLLWAATRAPSPANTQGWDFIVVTDHDKKQSIAEAISAVMLDTVAAMPRPDKTMRLILDGETRLLHTMAHVPCLIIVAGPVVYPPHAPREQFTWSAIYPAAQNLILAARALGLGSVFTTLQMVAEPKIRSILHIPDHIKLGALIPIGWPDAKFGPVKRRPVNDFVHRNGWEGNKRS
jgi:nitroreductase